MDDTHALRIISALANGLDPTSESPVESPSPIQNVEVIRALFIAVRALETTARLRTRKSRSRAPTNAGRTWTAQEDRQLLDRFDAGETVAQLAHAHERTPAGIQARLERHGRMRGPGLQWRGRAGPALANATQGERTET